MYNPWIYFISTYIRRNPSFMKAKQYESAVYGKFHHIIYNFLYML